MLGVGPRGRGSEPTAAPIWGLDAEEYLKRCDPWPLDPEGELLLGVKLESPEGVAHCEEILAVPGIGLRRAGPRRSRPVARLRCACRATRTRPRWRRRATRVFAACRRNGIAFLEGATPETIAAKIDEGVRVIAGGSEETARAGRAHQQAAAHS